MRRALRKLLIFVLTAGLMVGGPVCSRAQLDPCGSAKSYETKAVPNYADLSVDPEDDSGSPQAALPGTAHNDDGLCKKCCATCVGASLAPTTPVALATPSASRQMAMALDDGLVARPVPTEPGIPKTL